MNKRSEAVEAALKALKTEWPLDHKHIEEYITQLEQSTPTYAQGFREGFGKYEDWCFEGMGRVQLLKFIQDKVFGAIPVPTPSGSQGWLPWDKDVPKEGEFLVFIPGDSVQSGIQKAIRVGKNGTMIIAGMFSYDLPQPTHWQPLPAAPQVKGVGDE